MVPLLIVTAAILVGVYFLFFSNKEISGNWMQFYSKGKEIGFTIKDLEQLRQIVVNCKIKNPAGIFSSQDNFQEVVRSTVKAVQFSGDSGNPDTQFFLSKLFDHFKTLEMQVSERNSRITNSRQIGEGQTLRILVPGTGVYKSEVIKNTVNFLTISRPVITKTIASMQWHGARISVYFQRENDAGYVFDTEVTDEVFSKGISSLKVDHSDSLSRTQQRKSMRLKLKRMAFLYQLNEADNPHKLEKLPGVRCLIEDISDTGCAFKINGRANTGMRLKVQFTLDRVPICIPATVRSVDFAEDSNQSLVRMEADPLPIAVRNHILCEVFNMVQDEDDELPLRIPEEEASA